MVRGRGGSHGWGQYFMGGSEKCKDLSKRLYEASRKGEARKPSENWEGSRGWPAWPAEAASSRANGLPASQELQTYVCRMETLNVRGAWNWGGEGGLGSFHWAGHLIQELCFLYLSSTPSPPPPFFPPSRGSLLHQPDSQAGKFFLISPQFPHCSCFCSPGATHHEAAPSVMGPITREKSRSQA